MDLPLAPCPLTQISVTGQAAAAEHHELLVMQGSGSQLGAFMLHPPLRRVPHPSDIGGA